MNKIQNKKRQFFTVLSVLASVISVVALYFIVNSQDSVVQESHTNYIGQFPGQFVQLTNLLKKAEDSILIVSDVPCYGCFSAPEVFIEYRSTLMQKKKEGVYIEIITYDRSALINHTLRQFGIDSSNISNKETFNEFKERHIDKFEKFSSIYLEERSINNFSEFFATIDSLGNQVISISETKKRLKGEINNYCWLIDQKEAIISNQILGKNSYEISFYTNESEVIKLFLDFPNHCCD